MDYINRPESRTDPTALVPWNCNKTHKNQGPWVLPSLPSATATAYQWFYFYFLLFTGGEGISVHQCNLINRTSEQLVQLLSFLESPLHLATIIKHTAQHHHTHYFHANTNIFALSVYKYMLAELYVFIYMYIHLHIYMYINICLQNWEIMFSSWINWKHSERPIPRWKITMMKTQQLCSWLSKEIM